MVHQFPHPRSYAEPLWHRRAEQASSTLLYAMILFSAWAFGGWPAWSIWTMNTAGCLLGLLWVAKLAIRHITGYEPVRWGGQQPAVIRVSLGLVTVILLLWCLISAVNARAIADVDSLGLIQGARYVWWLPHSFDQPATWFVFWQYLGLAGVFWALRDWIKSASPVERRLAQSVHHDASGYAAELEHRLPHRLRTLIWILSIHGGAIALVGIASTISDPMKLLWVMPHETRGGGFFGPFYYRNNGAQFVNLIWPACLGLWLTYCLRAAQKQTFFTSLGRSRSAILPVCLGLMVAAPFISSSRGGSIIAVVMLVAAVPLLIVSMRLHRAVLILTGTTILLGCSLGIWLAWEPLSQRFFRDFIAYPTGIQGRLEEFTIRSTVRIPNTWGKEAATFAGLSDSPRLLWNTPGSMTLSLRRAGVFEARFVEADRHRVLTLQANHALLAQAGRTVEVIFVHRQQGSALFINGERAELRERRTRAGFDWPNTPASQFLWVGRGAGGSMKFNERIEVVTLLDHALPDGHVRALADPDPQPGTILNLDPHTDRWLNLDPQPMLNIRPYTLSPSQWLNAGLGGRGRVYASARQMMTGYPHLLGSGPGTFARLFMIFSQDNDETRDWYAHNDYLETRITFGLAGASLIYLGLLLCPTAALCRGGLRVPWYFLLLVFLGIAGALFHARFDWVFQTHALLFLAVVLLGVVSACCFRAGAGPGQHRSSFKRRP